MLGRNSARVLRYTPQHICLPCLRRQLIQPVSARSSSLSALRPALFHTAAAIQDQAQTERSSPLSDASSPSAPKPNDSEPSSSTPGNTIKQQNSVRKQTGRANAEEASQDPDQEKDQNEKTPEKSSLSEALNPYNGQNPSEDKLNFEDRSPGFLLEEATGLETNQNLIGTTFRRIASGDKKKRKKKKAKKVVSEEEKDAEKKSSGRSEARKKRSLGKGSKPGAEGVSHNGQEGKTEKPQRQRRAIKSSEEESHESNLANFTEYESLSAQELHLTPLDVNQPPVPSLAYGLDRVLFNPGVYHLQDPRTQIFNFDPYLSNVMPVEEFNFNSLGEYITSSRDTALSDLAREHQKTFVGSTSSMTASLAHFHYLLSSWRPINISMLSKDFPEKLRTFTKLNRLPASVFLRYKNGVYSIDADKEFDQSNILAILGKSLEKLLTLPTEEYERYRVSNPNQISEEERQQPESYHYTSMGDILMRSQLDAHDSRLPGTGMYDLKTRAVVSIRMDVGEWDKNTGYQIKQNLGQFESYEREYYDMVRSVLLKYSLQARMGRMDGIFVAYHNIERIFGFQYMSLEDMDRAIHGTKAGGRELGDQEFRLSVALLNKVLRRAIERFPETSLRIQFETRESQESPWMYIFAEPMTEDEIQAIQDTNKAQVQAFERRILGLDSEDSTESKALESALTEEAMEYDAGPADDLVEESVAETAAEAAIMSENTTSDDLVEESVAETAAEAAIMSENTTSEEVMTKDEVASEEVMTKDEVASEEVMTKDEVASEEVMTKDEVASEEVVTKDEVASDDAASEETPTESVVKESVAPEMTEGAAYGELSSVDDTVPGAAPKGDLPADDVAPGMVAEDQVVHDDATLEDAAGEQSTSNTTGRQLLALKLFVNHRVNGGPVPRPEDLDENSEWVVDYTMKEVDSPSKAMALFAACRKRRADGFSQSVQAAKGDKVLTYYQRLLRRMSAKGREWRVERDQELERNGRVVFEAHGASTDALQPWDLDKYLTWLYSRGAKGRGN